MIRLVSRIPRTLASALGMMFFTTGAPWQVEGFKSRTPLPTETTVHQLFTDWAVLQRGIELPVWGWDRPGAEVVVRLAGQERRTRTGSDGRWKVVLAPTGAGGPHDLIVDGTRKVRSSGLLFGDVWLASGQSNMEWPLSATKEYEEGRAAAEGMDSIRLFTVPRAASLEPLEMVEGGEWRRASGESVREFSATAWWFANKVHRQTGIPIGVLHASWGGTYVSSWMRRELTESHPEGHRWVAGLDQQVEDPGAPVPPGSRQLLHEGHLPGVLFHGMIHPLLPCALRGVIWYQGENDGIHPGLYADLFPMMIREWRRLWNAPELPFHFVQLAPFDTEAIGHPNWAHLREVQLRTWQSVPATGMAVITDRGTRDDIHPPMKQAVGERLARFALRHQYGMDIVESGPIAGRHAVEGACIRIWFDHVAGGLEARGGELRGFEIAGGDRRFHPAIARIDDGTVVVTSAAVPRPVAARYGWESCPDVNLFNSEGLPASPFRTDRW